MKNTGIEYEKLIQKLYENKVETEGSKIAIQHNVKIQGNAVKHQIDVYWETEQFKYLVQAKELNKRVVLGDMLTFKAVIDDIPNSKGIFITRIGFQSGAIKVAKYYDIDIFTLDDIAILNQPWIGTELIIKTKELVDYKILTGFEYKLKDRDYYMKRNRKDNSIEVFDKNTGEYFYKMKEP